jgi:para-nitrobenzyl esterase
MARRRQFAQSGNRAWRDREDVPASKDSRRASSGQTGGVPLNRSPWDGERDASRFGADCAALSWHCLHSSNSSEDCLFLNVWKPAGAEPEQAPVLVWIGGAFVFGSGSSPDSSGVHSPRRVMDHLQSRLGRLGFFAFPR